MWYEVIPTAMIIMAGLGLPPLAIKYLCIQFYDTPKRRLLSDQWDMFMFVRDSRLCDHPMTASKMGLENIPDE